MPWLLAISAYAIIAMPERHIMLSLEGFHYWLLDITMISYWYWYYYTDYWYWCHIIDYAIIDIAISWLRHWWYLLRHYWYLIYIHIIITYVRERYILLYYYIKIHAIIIIILPLIRRCRHYAMPLFRHAFRHFIDAGFDADADIDTFR
jgi:hypothetical protein